jgi:Nif-specific regulatory protein
VQSLTNTANGLKYGLEVLFAAQTAESITNLLNACLSIWGGEGVSYVALAEASQGQWQIAADAGVQVSIPRDLLANTLDHEQPESRDRWLAIPVTGARGMAVLALHFQSASHASRGSAWVVPLTEILRSAVESVGRNQRRLHRQRQLESLVEVSSRWNQHRDMSTLLSDMAQAATRLLEGDRASIFLWDRPTRTLVGRPALGVESGELRVPDDKGVVGEVVQRGEAVRVDAGDVDQQIDHRVDARLQYRTRNLICVPLRSRTGELLGAFEVLNKQSGNFTEADQSILSELASHAAIALENTQERADLLMTRQQWAEQAALSVQLIGDSPAIAALRTTVERVAQTDLAVLVLGENGTGKEVVSQAIHYLSRRREKPFVAVNCAALSETLLESELFGHEKGAFTDARQSRAGKFELASGGTLFLDEIGDLSLGGQAKLLRVLEEKVVVRVGGNTPIHTDARVIAATNQDLRELVRQRKFREDLFFRLHVVAIELPPLRERGDDVLVLAEYFIREFAHRARRKPPRLAIDAKKRMLAHTWPGNVRELRNLMERLVYLLPGDVITEADLMPLGGPTSGNTSSVSAGLELGTATDEFQRTYIQETIKRSRGNMSEAAKQLGLHRSNLYRKLRQLGLPGTP